MAAPAEQYESDLDDDRSEASGFSDDDEQLDEATELDSGANVSGEGGSDVHDSGDEADGAEGGGGDAGSSGDEYVGVAAGGATAGTSRDASGAAAAPADNAGPFKSSDKGAAIAKAFAKAARGPRDDTGGAILSGSKSVLKRQREEQALEVVDRQARLLRQEMRKRGHTKVPRKGEEPEQDAAEKLMIRTARRGVVRLFNAVSKAQKQHAEQQAVGGRAKDKQLTKADFLAELRGKSGASGAAAAPPAAKVGVSASEQAAAPDAPAWDALQDDYASLQSGLRMKDWDKKEEVVPIPGETMADLGSDSDDSD